MTDSKGPPFKPGSREDYWMGGGEGIIIFKREQSQCWKCANRVQGGGWTCKAFPAGIPVALIMNYQDHRYPFPNDNGIRLTPMNPDDEKNIVF